MKEQRGAVVIIEGAFVFPIMFFIVLFMLMAGEVYYQHSRVEKACITAAIRGAARCENPMLEVVQKEGSVPDETDAVHVMPYRYIFTGEAQKVANQVAKELREELKKTGISSFWGMEPRNVTVNIRPKMNVLISSFPVECSYEIQLPIRMIFARDAMKFRYTVQVMEPIGDPTEFVRNVSTVEDYLERVEFGEGITNFVEKIKEAMEKLGWWMS